jgi:hypothetical protein
MSSAISEDVLSHLIEDVDFQIQLSQQLAEPGAQSGHGQKVEWILAWLIGYQLHLLKVAKVMNAEDWERLRPRLFNAILDRITGQADAASLPRLTKSVQRLLEQTLQNSINLEATQDVVAAFVEHVAVGAGAPSAKELRGDCLNAAFSSAFAFRRRGYVEFDADTDIVRRSANLPPVSVG